MAKRALVTGGAGFIGSHLVDRLLLEGWDVVSVDNLDPFYPQWMKLRNIESQRESDQCRFVELDIRDNAQIQAQLNGDFDVIVHLAAKAGVRPSIQDPLAYQDVNVRGTHNLLEFARNKGVRQFVFASSSSVYGVNERLPWSEADQQLLPISPYAATKISGELLGHVYSQLFGLRFIGLRFFTVYGPRQRPDLAIAKFARLMLENEVIPLFGDGSSRRDYTFINDIVDGIVGAIGYTNSSYEIVNLGNNRTVSLLELVEGLETALGQPARRLHQGEQEGDVPATWADITKAGRLFGYQPKTELTAGLAIFARWLDEVGYEQSVLTAVSSS